jgi:sec-independent protein translocase protein TatA
MIGDILQPTHLLLILVVALLVLGPKRLPEAGRALGGGLRDFKMALSGERQDSHAEPASIASAPATPSVSPLDPVVGSPMPRDKPTSQPGEAAPPSIDSASKRAESDQPLG